jgi:hypothetical protein
VILSSAVFAYAAAFGVVITLLVAIITEILRRNQ